jgi:hypothetical protein
MAREKPYFRDVVADITERTGKMILGVTDIKQYLKIGRAKALEYLDGKKSITVFEFASKLL